MITAGEVLKNKRESLRKSLETVSIDTKIQKRFIEYIEADKYSYFDSEIFLTGFLKIYSNYLGLDTNKILALYRRSNPQKKEKGERKETVYTKKKLKLDILTPKNVVTAILGISIIILFSYIAIQIYRFQSPPKLEITEPRNEIEVNNEEITLKGTTEKATIVDINGTVVETGDQGNFLRVITLKEGVNIITITAKKEGNNTLETVETRKITYTKKEEEPAVEEKETESTLTLEITESSSWVKLDIDNENKISQIVEPSKVDYEVREKFEIITGRMSSTNLYYNGEPISWEASATTGVGSLSCTVKGFTVSCEDRK